MNELKQSTDSGKVVAAFGSVDYLALYNRFGAIAYGMILQIVPQEALAQQILVDVFSSAELRHCYTKTGSALACVIKITREKAFSAKQVLEKDVTKTSGNVSKAEALTPELLFNLSYKQGVSLDTISSQYNIAKPDILKAIREYVKSFRKL